MNGAAACGGKPAQVRVALLSKSARERTRAACGKKALCAGFFNWSTADLSESYDMSTTRVVATASAIMLTLAASIAPLRAHHSTAMYDMSQRKSIQGAIKTVEWTNPHVWLWVMVIADNPERATITGFEADRTHRSHSLVGLGQSSPQAGRPRDGRVQPLPGWAQRRKSSQSRAG